MLDAVTVIITTAKRYKMNLRLLGKELPSCFDVTYCNKARQALEIQCYCLVPVFHCLWHYFKA